MITTLYNGLLSPYYQEPTGTQNFFQWYFYGMGGIGGWLIFFLLALAATVWLYYDSQRRRLPAIGWRLGVILLTLLLFPTILYRFTVTPTQFRIYQILKLFGDDPTVTDVIHNAYPNVVFTDIDSLRKSLSPMTPYGEHVFYLGILGGVLAPVLAIGYYITFQGMIGCYQGHVYEAILGKCPECEALKPVRPTWVSGGVGVQGVGVGPKPPPPPPPKPVGTPLGYAWLVDRDNNRRYDLYQGTTRIGRDKENHIILTDPAVSRMHVQVREANGHFTLSDIGSSTGTLLNGKKLRNPQVLQNGDVITVGDTNLKFVTSL